eukprot:TRINITY_DN588_c0_g1_i1.p1 TRINITY_DN588_c0_g1~~TRINITY_DN588_c0_g1_i1.p1  ORF type:complete len:181 (+),score=19.63 TRINITY_DN588_c0_g1_i1:34-543(+)
MQSSPLVRPDTTTNNNSSGFLPALDASNEAQKHTCRRHHHHHRHKRPKQGRASSAPGVALPPPRAAFELPERTRVATPVIVSSVDMKAGIAVRSNMVGRGLARFLSYYNPAYQATPDSLAHTQFVPNELSGFQDISNHRKKDWVKDYMEQMSKYGGTLLRGTTMVKDKR